MAQLTQFTPAAGAPPPPPRPTTPESTQLSAQNPWPGLRAFTESDREFFFGREKETAELLELVQHSGAVVLYGQSGLGKTSLLQAGLFPELKKLDHLPVRVRFDHSEDAPPLADQIKAKLSEALDEVKSSAPRPSKGETLWEYFHRRDVDFWGPRNRLLTPVIMLDQFEEVFTLGQRDQRTAARVTQFASDLESVLEHRAPEAVRKRLEAHPEEASKFELNRQPAVFLISLREDFLPQLDPWRARIPSLLAKRFRLERMTGAQALDVVQRGGSDLLDSGAAAAIVDFVSRSKHDLTLRAVEQRDVEPALLSVVCDELNRRRVEQHQDKITVNLLTDERVEIIQDFYERSFDGVSPRVREWVEDKLLTASGFRNHAALDDAIKEGLPEADFDTLVNRRILHREERGGVVWLELTHDLLSDPASQSRAIREHKHQAEAAKELRVELRRSQKRGAIYAVLLLISVAAFVVAIFTWRLSVKNEAARDNAEEARHKADLDALRSQQSTEEAIKNMGIDLGGESWVPTSTVLHTIDKVEKGYSNLSSVVHGADDVKFQHAQFLAKASEALYGVGHFKEGVDRASEALALLDDIKQPSKLPDFTITRAEALYDRGKGLLETAQVDPAAKDFDAALEVTQPAPGNSNHDTIRIYETSLIGRGDAEKSRLNLSGATNYYQRALDFAKANSAMEEESVAWQSLALIGLSNSQTEDEVAVGYADKAENLLEGSRQFRNGSLRQKRLYVDAAAKAAYFDISLQNPDEAEALLRKADENGEELLKRDPDNLVWRLSHANVDYENGWIHLDRGEWELSEKDLKAAEETSEDVVKEQSDWAAGQILRGATTYDLGQLIWQKHFHSPEVLQSSKDFDTAWQMYGRARQQLKQVTQSSPQSLALLSEAISAEGLVYEYQAQDPGISAPAAQKKRSDALAAYASAAAVLAPIADQRPSLVARIDAFKASTLWSEKRYPETISAYSDELKVEERMANKSKTPAKYYDLSLVQVALANAYWQVKDPANAATQYAHANDSIDTALKIRRQSCHSSKCPLSAQDLQTVLEKAEIQAAMFDFYRGQSNLSEALDHMAPALKTVWDALQQSYGDVDLNKALDRYLSVANNVEVQLEKELDAKGSPTQPNAKEPRSRGETAKLLQRVKEIEAGVDPKKLLVRNEQRGWFMPPMMPGNWETLSGDEFEGIREQLLTVDHRFTRNQIRAVRALPVDFYEDSNVYEADIYDAPKDESKAKELGIASYIRRQNDIQVLTGKYQTIQSMNEKSPPQLDTSERATNFLRFYIGSIQTDTGRFMLVDRAEDLRWSPGAKIDNYIEVQKKIRPLVVQALPDGGWQAIGTVQYSNNLAMFLFELPRVGFVNPLRYGDNLLDNGLPVIVEQSVDGVRCTKETAFELTSLILERSPDDANALRKMADLDGDLARYKERAEVQGRLVEILERTTTGAEARRKTLAPEYQNLAWDRLIAGDFDGALAAADTGIKLDASVKPLAEYRAHALWFLGRRPEAGEIYAQLEKEQDWPKMLGRRVGIADLTKHWKEAAETEQQVINYYTQNLKDEQARRKELSGDYTNLTWVKLFTRDFQGSLDSCYAARQAVGEYMPVETNCAHALLLLGKVEDAEAIYLKYRGQKIPDSSKTWDETIVDDFKTLQEAKVSSPEMPRIAKELTGEQK